MDNEGSKIFWSAFGGGAAAGIITLLAVILAEWFRWFLDRPLVRVTMMFARVNKMTYGFDPSKTYISLDARNPHSKSVTLSSFGFYYKKPKKWGKIYVFPDGQLAFPYELKGGKSISQLSYEGNLFDGLFRDGRKPSDLGRVYFQAASGKVFFGKIPKVSMKVLEEHYTTYIEAKANPN